MKRGEIKAPNGASYLASWMRRKVMNQIRWRKKRDKRFNRERRSLIQSDSNKTSKKKKGERSRRYLRIFGLNNPATKNTGTHTHTHRLQRHNEEEAEAEVRERERDILKEEDIKWMVPLFVVERSFCIICSVFSFFRFFFCSAQLFSLSLSLSSCRDDRSMATLSWLFSAFCFLLFAFCFFAFYLWPFTFCFLAFAFCFLLFAFCFLLFAFCFLLFAFCFLAFGLKVEGVCVHIPFT